MTTVMPPPFTPHGHQTLRDAFDEFGRRHFPNTWTSSEVDEWMKSRDLSRWAQTLDAFVQELEARRTVIVMLLADGRLWEVPTSYWRVWNAGERLAEYLIESEFPYFVPLSGVADAKATVGAAEKASKRSKVGRKSAADWDAHKTTFMERCANGNLPDDPDNEWGSKTKAIDWLIKLVTTDEVVKAKRTGEKPYEPSNSAARDWIDKWIAELKDGN